MPHTVNESSLDVPYLSATSHCIFNPDTIYRTRFHLYPWHYLSTTISSTAQSPFWQLFTCEWRYLFAGFGKNLNNSNYHGRGMLLSQNLPVRSSVLHSVVFSQTIHPHFLSPRLPPSSVLDRPQTPAPKKHENSFLSRLHLLHASQAVHHRVY